MSYLMILNEIAATDSTKQKEALLKVASNNETLKRIYQMTYSRRIQYGIKKIPLYTPGIVLLELFEALDFLEKVLATRKLTGHAAQNKLAEVMSNLSLEDAEVIRRVILRDLECGASRTMANKVWKNLVPEQPQMLASSYSEKSIANIKFPAYAQLKADGARCFAEIRGDSIDDVKLFSRAGNEYLGLDVIKKQLIDATAEERQAHPGGVLIDGELVYIASTKPSTGGGLSFLNDIEVTGTAVVVEDKTDQKAVVLRSESNGFANKSLKGTITADEADNMSFQVWDLVPLDVVYSEGKEKSEPYDVRFQHLTWAIDSSHTRLIVIENTLVNSLAEARLVYQNYVDQGLEGIILKNTFGLWENKRSKNQVKFKEVIDIDMKIVGVYCHSKDPNKLGGVELESKCGRVKVNCGSGFTDTDATKVKGEWIPIPLQERDELNRAKLWANRDALIGAVAELECNGWVAAEGRKGTVGLFLPIIKKLRIDKTDANTFEDAFGISFSDTGVEE